MTSTRHSRHHTDADDDGAIAGMFLTVAFSYPYLSNRVQSFPRSTGHDIALAAVLALFWSTWFFWDHLGRRFPRLQAAIAATGHLLGVASVAALFITAYYLIFTT